MSLPEAALAPHAVDAAGLCIGCGACAAGDAAMDFDRYGQIKPSGPWTREASASVAKTCPFSPSAMNEDEIAAARFGQASNKDERIGRFESAHVGYVAQGDYRENGSSGGMVSWVAATLLERGLIDGVAHVAPVDPGEGRFFRYRISRTADQVRAGARSRYYPVDMVGVLDEMRAVPGRYAVVGVPCFIKAVNLLRAHDAILHERIAFTLGLFCGHMKSARFVDSFAWQLGVDIGQVRAVEYRRKDPARPANWYTAHLMLSDGDARWRDWWHLVDGDWGAGFFQNSACNYCDDVVAETADISFGDAWVEPYASDGRGTNVVIARSRAMHYLIASGMLDGRLQLDPVDAEFIADTQAAGFRQRREGLAYRLHFAPPGLPLRKRVEPGGSRLGWRRKLVYRARRWIAAGSHRMMYLARASGWRGLYLGWARGALRGYEAVAYLRGRVGRWLARLDRSTANETV